MTGRPRLTVRPLHLSGDRQLEVDWKVDGKAVQPSSPDHSWFDPAALALPAGRRVTVTATVRDTTDWVRDEVFRDQHMTRTVSWVLTG